MERNFCNFAKGAIRDHFMMIDNLLFEADKINDEKVLDKIRMELDEILPRIVHQQRSHFRHPSARCDALDWP